ncbi:zinc carboxypeptidase [Tenacibaculum skagerrakense]|uniref:Zinc carboxypeptidase n=1 Tax=Tenacibaculum skagerrakense TaxID=186571 RepID=A0A4V2SMD2_9FLAO|nr:M14 metallopeptidase family protein [Tenacibaculum skagerrakense]TCP26806.1 zinc carboxypeptidase [Tenacibaculum skagerrakense]
MRFQIIVATLFLSLFSVFSQKIQSPSEFLEYPLGSQFTRHHQVVDYFKHLAENSENITLEKYGQTYERRKLQVAYISSKNNINNIESIRKQHLTNANLDNTNALTDKAIVWLSYNVHGNEASSTEAAMLTAYKLLTEKKAWLDNVIIIIDPCINPDGRDRYVNWFNQVSNNKTNTNPLALEHNEPWIQGRPNHYLFDLNRDWAWTTQIESQQRIKLYNKWMPHIHVDFHEQYYNNPYYFAPAAEPFHEIITEFQRDFQNEIGKNHARYFDENGWLYFTKESFDLLYPSYGDTYPTFNGAIGMTYEQAGHGKAGLGIKTDEGDTITLKDRLLHHTTTGLSTVEVASKEATKLNNEFKKYFSNNDYKYQSYVLQGNSDKINALKKLLDRHEIKYSTTTDKEVKGFIYRKNSNGKINLAQNNLSISTNQPKGKLVEVLFEPKTVIKDSLTYDITSWSLPYAYGLDAVATKKAVATISKEENISVPTIKKQVYAYVFDWNHITDAALLTDLLQHKIRVRTTSKTIENSDQKLLPGSLIVRQGDNKHIQNFDTLIYEISKKHHKVNNHITTGLSTKGPDLGSYSVTEIKNSNIAVLGGKGISTLSYGEVRYFLEQDLNYTYSAIQTSDLSTKLLSKFDVIILPSGNYTSILNNEKLKALKSWISQGGKVISIGNANQVFAKSKDFSLTTKQLKKKKDSSKAAIEKKVYAETEREQIKELITGAIFKTQVDNTHPLGFGYSNEYFTLKLGTNTYDFLKSGNNIVTLDDNSVISGFAGSKTLEKQQNSLIFGTEEIGNGAIIYLVDNPLFRGFWDNGKLFFANSLFMVK